MPTIKSFSVGHGDMFYIKHGSSNFTIIDCNLNSDNCDDIIEEIAKAKSGKSITRFISTHPDEDHLCGLDRLDDELGILNFYCVKNKATKPEITEGFERYCKLRDSSKVFILEKGCRRRYMNLNGEDIGSSGLNILWPITDNEAYQSALDRAEAGEAFNNISIILRYELKEGASALWMGDLETDFMEEIKDEVSFPETDILFMPHHGRKSSKIPSEWMDQINPKVLIKGESNSKDQDYVSNPNRNKIHQNSAKNIVMDLEGNKVHFFVSAEGYCVDFLDDEDKLKSGHNYIGTLTV